MRVAEVIWDDAFIDTEDIKIKKARNLKPVRRSTVGYFITSNDECIVLATDYFHPGKSAKEIKEASAPMVIPMGMVIEWAIIE